MWKSLMTPRRQRTAGRPAQRQQRSELGRFEREHHLLRVPPIGATVVLITEDQYLREHHGAAPGQRGTVVRHSRLNTDDRGVLVNWGATPGSGVRMNLDELRLPN